MNSNPPPAIKLDRLQLTVIPADVFQHRHLASLSLFQNALTALPDALWQQAVGMLGEQRVIDLTVLSGTYVMVSMLLNATQVGIPGGGAAPLMELEALEIRRRLLA